jgi:hypothetical protein
MEFGLPAILELVVTILALVICVRPERMRPIYTRLIYVAFLASFVAMLWVAKMLR